jgi:hypothetical protein
MHDGITLRYGFPDDSAAVARLAALDSAEVPAAPLLVAEVGGELQAAVSLGDGRVIADPFHPTLALVALLRERAAQLTTARGSSGRSRIRRTAARLRSAA